MRYRVTEGRDFRGTLHFKDKGEIVEIEDTALAKQFKDQGFVEEIVEKVVEKQIKEKI